MYGTVPSRTTRYGTDRHTGILCLAICLSPCFLMKIHFVQLVRPGPLAIECTHCTQLISPSPCQMDAFQRLEGENQVEEFDMVVTEISQSGFLRDPLVNQLPVSCFSGFVAFGCWFVLYYSSTGKASLCGFCRGPLLEQRVPPVMAGRRGCPSSPTAVPRLPSSALKLVGTAAWGVTCCVAGGHRVIDGQNELPGTKV